MDEPWSFPADVNPNMGQSAYAEGHGPRREPRLSPLLIALSIIVGLVLGRLLL